MITRRIERAFAYLLLVLIGIIGFAPFVVILLLSTKARIEILQVPPTLDFDIDQIVSNYRNVLIDRGFLGYTLNSIVVTTLTVIVALLVATPAAYAFSRIPFRRRDGWANTVLSLRFMPAVAVAIPILLMMRFLDLDDTLPGLVIPYVAFSLPLVIWILIGFFDEIPRELDDAAMVDGCSRFRVLTSVMLPLVRPGLIVSSIFAAIFIWNEFLVGMYIVNSQSLKTIPLGAAGLISAQRPIDWNVAATVGVVTIIPIFVFSLFVQRYIVRGITAGAVK
ncbi:MAG: carbohydrate ABC transporter permease [Chloroflexi bacterium]|nr:carbohydrate ABC transporter permease [Chloroflexota bacterium]